MPGDRWLIAGLGNPGPSYAANRHNAGFLTADVLAARAGARFRASKYRAMTADARLAGPSATIIKPLTFMNESGSPVAGVAGFYWIPAGRVVVIHDELDLPFGSIRLKLGGGDNGHNGLRSVTARRAGWTRPPTCSGISPPRSGRSCPWCWSAPRTRWRCSWTRASTPHRMHFTESVR